MADSDIQITAGSGTKVDTRTVGAGTDEHRQVVCIGDPSTAASVVSVSSAFGDGESNTQNGLVTDSYNMLFNGTTWDRIRGDTTNGIDVDVTRVSGSVAVVGDVADGATDSGNPLKIGAFAEQNLATSTVVSDGQRTNVHADIDGVLYVKPYTSYGDIKSERITDTAGTSVASTAFSAVASTRNFITTITVYNSSTTNGYLDLRDGTAGSVIYTIPLPALGGATIQFPVPLRQPTANTALAYDVSAAITTVYISVVGFQSKA